MSQPIGGFPIGYVSSYTGLSTHVLRAWERRYNAVKPNVPPEVRRFIPQTDIEDLSLLKQWSIAGTPFQTWPIRQNQTEELADRCKHIDTSGQRHPKLPSVIPPLRPMNEKSLVFRR